MSDLPKPINTHLKFYSKLHYYRYFYSECLKAFADMSWWTFHKIARIIRKELPKYEPDEGKRIHWEITRIYANQKHDIFTGKPTGKKNLIRIDIDGYLAYHVLNSFSKVKLKIFEYDLERGRLFIHGFGSKHPYADLHPTDKGFKLL